MTCFTSKICQAGLFWSNSSGFCWFLEESWLESWLHNSLKMFQRKETLKSTIESCLTDSSRIDAVERQSSRHLLVPCHALLSD